jgi:hypothetical protein
MKFRTWIVLLLVLSPLTAIAQPLADRVPDDAIIYLGWRGADEPGPGYSDSRLKGLLDVSALPQLSNDILPKLLDIMAAKDHNAAIFREMLGKLGPAFWKYPTALYVGPVDGLNAFSPMPRIALMCKAGAGAAQLKKDINSYLDQLLTNATVPITAIEEDGIVAITLGNVTPDLAGKTKTSLVNRKEFSAAMAQVGKEPLAVAYVDMEALTALIDQVAAIAPQMAGKWQVIRETLGLGGLKRLVWTAGFETREFVTQGFVMAPAPRTGLLQLLDLPPLSDAALKTVPESATMVLSGNFDFARLLTLARDLGGKVDPNVPNGINMGLGMGSMTLGINIETDLLQPLGNEWIIYASPTVGGVGPLGIVVVNKTRDGAKLETALTRLEGVANTGMQGDAPKNHSYGFGDKPHAKFVDAMIDGQKVHYLNTPFLSPAWTIKDGNLYVALYPQTAVAAANASTKTSILNNENFVAIRKQLGGEKASSIAFFDLPKSTPVGYPYMLALSRVTGIIDMFGLPTPPAVLPSLEKLMPLMSPAGSVAWTDDTGVHTRSTTPFPGATMLSGPEALLVEGQALIGPLMGLYQERQKAAMTPATPAPAAQQ